MSASERKIAALEQHVETLRAELSGAILLISALVAREKGAETTVTAKELTAAVASPVIWNEGETVRIDASARSARTPA